MLIHTENTPNPDAIKFLPNLTVAGDLQIHFADQEQARKKSNLASNLFDVDGVVAVFFGSDFITVTKSATESWDVIKPEILMIIMDHFTLNLPIFHSNISSHITVDTIVLSEIEKQIIEIIETRVRPSVAMDGGDIIYRGFKDGIVQLELHGACSGCPSSAITLKNGIESMLKHFVPEVRSVEAISE